MKQVPMDFVEPLPALQLPDVLGMALSLVSVADETLRPVVARPVFFGRFELPSHTRE